MEGIRLQHYGLYCMHSILYGLIGHKRNVISHFSEITISLCEENFGLSSLENCFSHVAGRELQKISGNNTYKVGYLSMKEIRGLASNHQHSLKFNDANIPTLDDALKLISRSVRLVILDAKVGPPLHEKELAKDILSIVERNKCKNCIIWAKSDSLVRDIIRLSTEIKVGYIVMMDLLTGARTNLLRMRGAEVVGVYHPLIDEKVVRILHGRNKKVYGWTVDDEDSMKKMLLEHVDAIVTSNPSLLHRVMQDTRTRCFEQGFSLSS